MAGKLKTGEMKDILRRLNDINSSLDCSITKLVQNQNELSKAFETQKCLNKSLKPLYAAFSPHEDPSSINQH